MNPWLVKFLDCVCAQELTFRLNDKKENNKEIEIRKEKSICLI